MIILRKESSNFTATIKKSINVLLIVSSLALPKLSYSQDSLRNANKKIAESNCFAGQGNGTLKISLQQLESIIIDKYKLSAFKKIMPKYLCEYNLTYSGNMKTKEFDIPNFEFTYTYTDKDFNPTGITIAITIQENINSRIKYLTVSGLSASTYDTMLKTLNKYYLYRGSMSNNYEKHFVSKSKSHVIVLKKEYGNYSLQIVS